MPLLESTIIGSSTTNGQMYHLMSSNGPVVWPVVKRAHEKEDISEEEPFTNVIFQR